MAKTNITTKEGTKIIIEGTPEEIAIILKRIREEEKSSKKLKQQDKNRSVDRSSGLQRATPTNLIKNLIGEGFFKKPKKIGEVKDGLEEKGRLYSLSMLSPALLRLIRKRQLRRVKEKGVWLYTN